MYVVIYVHVYYHAYMYTCITSCYVLRVAGTGAGAGGGMKTWRNKYVNVSNNKVLAWLVVVALLFGQ